MKSIYIISFYIYICSWDEKKLPGVNKQRRYTGMQGRQMTWLIGIFVKVSNSIERPLCIVCIVFLFFSLFYETQCTQYTVLKTQFKYSLKKSQGVQKSDSNLVQ